MTAFVPIETGDFVMLYRDECLPPWGDLLDTLDLLQYRGSGWDYMWSSSQLFDVVAAGKVTAKTFKTSDGKRRSRFSVVATARTEGELIALRDKLFSIGKVADDAIDREARRLIAPFEAKTREAARKKIKAALPHIYGGRS
ncbi:hypothetical protein C5748_25775 [Phyllobacterium phragmitis]|uniref:Uncharacterized protein n=1 Tax=Phyllobacterium phragmitis TaxID=2670329 RepID=A0A2S9IJI2_9HYPH|nr:hypothetical protein [Phyllobacterium phragmitis]PRD40677.1 hypothetical protein C5748_25775 [Phyllobacterium phragmitis]